MSMILDIPTANVGKQGYPFNTITACRDRTLDHLRFFEKEHVRGKVTWLNVVQANSHTSGYDWYNAVKKFDFCDGWAIAGKKRKSFTRADQELRYRDFCLARLEDKPVGDETGCAQLEADVKRFSAAWCGDMPSVLFVATSGARATLLAFGRDSTARAFRELDLSSAAGRQELFIAIVSVSWASG
jgi:hypothetical protein